MKLIFLLLLVAFIAGILFLYFLQHYKQILKWLANSKISIQPQSVVDNSEGAGYGRIAITPRKRIIKIACE